MKYTISIAIVFICDFALLCADVITTGNIGLWLTIHLAGDMGLLWLLNNSVETNI